MGNKLYVGNLPYTVRDDDLSQSFGEFGTVTSAKVMMERDTGRSKGFGFVEMGDDAQAQAARYHRCWMYMTPCQTPISWKFRRRELTVR